MRILITGNLGYVGSELTNQLHKIGYEVVGVDLNFFKSTLTKKTKIFKQIIKDFRDLNDNDLTALEDLYKRSSMTLLVVSGFIFLLIVLNINQLYLILPKEFTGGLFVVFIVSLAKLYDNSLGNNNAILFNSEYYKMVLYFGVFLAITAIVLNIIFIPRYGIEGSALATFLAIVFYNTVKILFVKRKFNMQPFSAESLKICLLLVVSVLVMYFWDFPFHPILNIALKSALIGILYFVSIYKLNVSEDVNEQIKRYLKF